VDYGKQIVMPYFNGRIEENAQKFLRTWTREADSSGWSKRQMVLRFVNSLRGQASIWYETRFGHLPNPASEIEAVSQWSAITAAFAEKYNNPARLNLARAQMWGRKHRYESGESLSAYLDAVM